MLKINPFWKFCGAGAEGTKGSVHNRKSFKIFDKSAPQISAVAPLETAFLDTQTRGLSLKFIRQIKKILPTWRFENLSPLGKIIDLSE